MGTPADGYRYLFGPVPSRRFGRSLGIDLVPFKTCTLDCLFCEVGVTSCATTERRTYAPVAAILSEFDRWLAAGGRADVITLTGSGEPTLHAGLGDVVRGLRARGMFRIALLTNSTLLHLPEVRRDVALVDLVKASLSAWDEASFARLHRPVAGVTFAGLVDGLTALRAMFEGELWLEVMVVRGFNEQPAQVRRIAALANPLRADRIQLNSVVRPPAHAGTTAVATDDLAGLCGFFDPRAEVIAPVTGKVAGDALTDPGVVEMLARRPCTPADIAALTGEPEAVVNRRLDALVAQGKLGRQTRGEQVYYHKPVSA